MKKNYLFYFVGLLCGTTNAQIITGGMISGPVSFNPCHSSITTNPSWTSVSQKLYSACDDVKVGIGTSNPTHSLHVPLNARFGDAKIDYSMGIGAEPYQFTTLYIKNGYHQAGMHINQAGNTRIHQEMLSLQYDEPTTKVFKAYNTTSGVVSFLFEANGKMTVNNGISDIFYLDPSGKLVIRNNSQKIFQLESNGLLRVRNVRVDTESWADYVFKAGYKLMPLYEVECFINEKGHLPNIPSEQEIITDGIDVAEMN